LISHWHVTGTGQFGRQHLAGQGAEVRVELGGIQTAYGRAAGGPSSLVLCEAAAIDGVVPILGYKIFVVIWPAVVTLRVPDDNELGELRIEHDKLPWAEVGL
jgi:hypothetical protein